MKRNKLKLLTGLILIILIVVGWLVLIVLNNWKAGGGIILVLLISTVISRIWKNMVIQKEIPIENSPISKNVISSQNIENQIIESSLQNTIQIKQRNKPYFSLLWSLLIFNLAFHQEILNEGNRRLLIILSLFIPFILGMLYCKIETDGDHYLDDESFYFGFVCLYILFHISIRIYKWVMDGYELKTK